MDKKKMYIENLKNKLRERLDLFIKKNRTDIVDELNNYRFDWVVENIVELIVGGKK